jgi:hypothetical protein
MTREPDPSRRGGPVLRNLGKGVRVSFRGLRNITLSPFPILLLLLLASVFSDASYGADRIAKWRQGRQAALSLSTDDGYHGAVTSGHSLSYGDIHLLPDGGINNPNLWGPMLANRYWTNQSAYPGGATYNTICARYGIAMTHFIDTREIDEPPDHIPSNPSPQSPEPNPPWEHNYGYIGTLGPGDAGTWDDWAYVASLGHEIASHSVHHPPEGIDFQHLDAPIWNGTAYNTPFHAWLPLNRWAEGAAPLWWREYLDEREGGLDRSFSAPVDELAVCKWRIERQLRARADTFPSLANYTVYTFAYPKGDGQASYAASPYYVCSRLTFGGAVNGTTGPSDWQRISSLAWPNKDLPQFQQTLDDTIANGGWLNEWGHALGSNAFYFDQYVAYAAAKRSDGLLWIDTVGNVARYFRERLDAQLSVNRSQLNTQGLITVTLTLQGLLNSPIAAVYNYPLTLCVDVPGWENARVQQGSDVQVVSVSAGVAQFEAIPDGGPIALTMLAGQQSQINADMDGDGDVDGFDFLTFANCYNGSGYPPLLTCESLFADIDGDEDVDGFDFLTFSGCYNGSSNPPHCQ